MCSISMGLQMTSNLYLVSGGLYTGLKKGTKEAVKTGKLSGSYGGHPDPTKYQSLYFSATQS